MLNDSLTTLEIDHEDLRAAKVALQKLFDQTLDFDTEPKLNDEERPLIAEYSSFLVVLPDYKTPYLTEVFAAIDPNEQNWKQNALAILKQRALALIHQDFIMGLSDANKKAELIRLLRQKEIAFDEIRKVATKATQLKKIIDYIEAVFNAPVAMVAKAQLEVTMAKHQERRFNNQAKDIARTLVYSNTTTAHSSQVGVQLLVPNGEKPEVTIACSKDILTKMGVDEASQNFLSENINQNGFTQAADAHFRGILTKYDNLSPTRSESTCHVEKRQDGSTAVTTITCYYGYTQGHESAQLQNPHVSNGAPRCTTYATFVVKNNPEIFSVGTDPFANIELEVERCFLEVDEEVSDVIKSQILHDAAEKLRQDKPLDATEQAAREKFIADHTFADGTLNLQPEMSADGLFVLALHNSLYARQIFIQLENQKKIVMTNADINKIAAAHQSGEGNAFQTTWKKLKVIPVKMTIEQSLNAIKAMDASLEKGKELADFTKTKMANPLQCQLVFEVIQTYDDKTIAALLKHAPFAVKFTQEQLVTLASRSKVVAEVVLQATVNHKFYSGWFGTMPSVKLTAASLQQLVFNNENAVSRGFIAEEVSHQSGLIKLLMQTEVWQDPYCKNMKDPVLRKQAQEKNANFLARLYVEAPDLRDVMQKSIEVMSAIIDNASRQQLQAVSSVIPEPVTSRSAPGLLRKLLFGSRGETAETTVVTKLKRKAKRDSGASGFQAQFDRIKELIESYKSSTHPVRKKLVDDSQLLDKVLLFAAPGLLPEFIEADKKLGVRIAKRLVELYQESEVPRAMIGTPLALFASEEFSRQFLFGFAKPKVLEALGQDGVTKSIFENHPKLLLEFAKTDLSEYQTHNEIRPFVDTIIQQNKQDAAFMYSMDRHNHGFIHISRTPRVSLSGQEPHLFSHHAKFLGLSPASPQKGTYLKSVVENEEFEQPQALKSGSVKRLPPVHASFGGQMYNLVRG